MSSSSVIACVVYRCSQQQDMYVYLRADLKPADVPEALRSRTGALTAVMNLDLHPQRRLARVDVLRVIEALTTTGYFLQLPPNGAVNAKLNFGGG
jgi:uncharacterized protein YcgL (UPF0745 family)